MPQENQGGHDEEFIGDGIQEMAKGRDLVFPPGQVAVQEVREGRQEEDDGGHKAQGFL